jgi:hypothetical protein
VAHSQGPSGLLRFQVGRATAMDGWVRCVWNVSRGHTCPSVMVADGHAFNADVAINDR